MIPDTDSIVYFITGDNNFNFYEDMVKNKTEFDLSDFGGSLKEFNNQENKKVVGKMKDEFPTSAILAFAAAKPKMYGVRSIVEENGEFLAVDKLKAKGINRAAIKHHMTFDQYAMVLEYNVQTEVKLMSIRSRKHLVTTDSSIKKALNSFDTKRLVIDAVNTLAHGHKDTPLFCQ